MAQGGEAAPTMVARKGSGRRVARQGHRENAGLARRRVAGLPRVRIPALPGAGGGPASGACGLLTSGPNGVRFGATAARIPKKAKSKKAKKANGGCCERPDNRSGADWLLPGP